MMTASPQSADEATLFSSQFYDLETSAKFCASSTAMAAEPQSKSGRELHCLRVILKKAQWPKQAAGAPANLIDLGTGSGTKARAIATCLADAAIGRISFHPVDASIYCANYAVAAVLTAFASVEKRRDVVPQLLAVAPEGAQASSEETGPHELTYGMLTSPPRDPVASVGPIITATRGHHADFVERMHEVLATIRKSETFATGQTIFALLGQTIGNFDDGARRALLAEIFSVMEEGDQLLLDAGVRPEEGDPLDFDARRSNLEDAYRLEAYAFMHHKADTEESVFRVAYDEDTHQVDHWFERPDGTVQPLGFSRMFSQAEFISSVTEAGYRVLQQVCSINLPELAPGPECIVMLLEKPALAVS